MLRWLDRLNERLVRRIVGPGDALRRHPQGLQLPDGNVVQWSDLERAVAFRQPGYVGDEYVLALQFDLELRAMVAQGDDLWGEALQALDAHPRRLVTSSEWLLQLIATPKEEHAVIEVLP